MAEDGEVFKLIGPALIKQVGPGGEGGRQQAALGVTSRTTFAAGPPRLLSSSHVSSTRLASPWRVPGPGGGQVERTEAARLHQRRGGEAGQPTESPGGQSTREAGSGERGQLTAWRRAHRARLDWQWRTPAGRSFACTAHGARLQLGLEQCPTTAAHFAAAAGHEAAEAHPDRHPASHGGPGSGGGRLTASGSCRAVS